MWKMDSLVSRKKREKKIKIKKRERGRQVETMKIDVLQGKRWQVSSVSAALWNVWMCDCLRCQDCYILLWRGSVHLSHSPVLGIIVYTRCQTPSVHRQVPWKAYFRNISYYFLFLVCQPVASCHCVRCLCLWTTGL